MDKEFLIAKKRYEDSLKDIKYPHIRTFEYSSSFKRSAWDDWSFYLNHNDHKKTHEVIGTVSLDHINGGWRFSVVYKTLPTMER